MPERHVGMLIKDLFKDASKKGGLAERLSALAREALPPKAASDKGLTAGDFSAWCEHTRPHAHSLSLLASASRQRSCRS